MGRHLWTCVAVTALLALAPTPPPRSVAARRHCRRTRLIPAGPDVPGAVARFAGAWAGALTTPTSADTLCHTLVVEEVFSNGFVRVIYTHRTHEGLKILEPQFWRATGRVVDGVLRFQLPTAERPAVVYRFGGGMLSGTFKGEANAALPVTRSATGGARSAEPWLLRVAEGERPDLVAPCEWR